MRPAEYSGFRARQCIAKLNLRVTMYINVKDGEKP